MLTVLKDRAVAALAAPGIRRLVASSATSSLVIIMMHRFRRAAGDDGHTPEALGRILQQLRSARVEIVDVEHALDAFINNESGLRVGTAARPRVAFTIDDGYADAVEVGGPVFAEFDVPVTCFVVPQVVEGEDWYWWDKIETALHRTAREGFVIEHLGERRTFALRTPRDRRVAFDALCEWIKRVPTDTVSDLLAAMSHATDVELPSRAPASFRVLSWEAMRAAEPKGWRFGAHTMTHPVIGNCTNARADWEIGASLAAVRARLTNPTGVFCYPVGREGDFGERDMALMQRHGVHWALSAIPARLRPNGPLLKDPHWRWRVPRFAHDERPGGLMRMLLSP